MPTKESTIVFVAEQMSGAGVITAKKMFGEYGVYCDGIIVALVCDDTLFVKPTELGCAFVGKVTWGVAYPGAKPSINVGDKIEDDEWLSALIKLTTIDLVSKGKAKNKKAKKGSMNKTV